MKDQTVKPRLLAACLHLSYILFSARQYSEISTALLLAACIIRKHVVPRQSANDPWTIAANRFLACCCFRSFMSFASKFCKICGREISYRAKFARNWDAIQYCSNSCRTTKLTGDDLAFESTILEMLKERRAPKALLTCEDVENRLQVEKDEQPKEGTAASPETIDAQVLGMRKAAWRERCRRAARRLHNEKRIVILQDGKPVNPSFAKGTMQLALPS